MERPYCWYVACALGLGCLNYIVKSLGTSLVCGSSSAILVVLCNHVPLVASYVLGHTWKYFDLCNMFVVVILKNVLADDLGECTGHHEYLGCVLDFNFL